MSKHLIVNADDYGLTPGVARGILQGYRLGIITSTTAMMNMPGIQDSLRLARQHEGLGLGVHLVFTARRPVLPPEQVPNLVDEQGDFLQAHVWQTRLDTVDLDELWAEWQAQLALFRRLAGEPDHLDCHHFVHLYPPIFQAYLKLARESGLPARVPFPGGGDDDRRDAAAIAFGHNFGIGPEVVQLMLSADRALLGRFPVAHPGAFFGGFYGDETLTLATLLYILEGLPEGVSEIMVHPGLADDDLCGVSRYSWQRERELELLCHPVVKERLAALGIALASYRVLTPGGA
jgi:chitin disaccharide deacetylase